MYAIRSYYDNRTVPVGLRVNPLRGPREQLIERLAAEQVSATPARYSPDLVRNNFV